MGKNEFKKAVGHLLKNREIRITEAGIHRIDKGARDEL